MNTSLKLKTLNSVKKTYQSEKIHPKLATINQIKTPSRNPNTTLSKSMKKQEKPVCAFHEDERITNFCRSKACLLPLCPKCVPIHTLQHIKLGFHGEFTTIEDEISESQKQIFLSMQKISQVQQAMITRNEQFQNEIINNKQIIKSIRIELHGTIDQIFDTLQKAWCEQYEQINKKIADNLVYIVQYLPTLTEMANVSLNKLKSTQYVLEGVITNFTFLQEIKQFEQSQQKLMNQKIQKIPIQIQSSQTNSLIDCIKKYLTWGQHSEQIWKNIDSKSSLKDNMTLPKPKTQLVRIVSENIQHNLKLTSSVEMLQKAQSFQKGLSLNLSLDNFKSPLQSFSLQNFRKNESYQL